MFEVIEMKDSYKVIVSLKKRVYAGEKRIYINVVNALDYLLEMYPQAKVEKNLDKSAVVSNVTEPHSYIWVFNKILEKEKIKKKQKSLEALTEMTEEFVGYEKVLAEDLTEPEKSDNVEETTQSLSDQPAIVQEPTE